MKFVTIAILIALLLAILSLTEAGLALFGGIEK